MRKTLLALSITAVVSLNATAAQLSGDDLLSIDDILNESTTTSQEKNTNKEESVKETKKAAKQPKKKAETVEEQQIPETKPVEKDLSVKSVVQDTTAEDYVPKLMVPVPYRIINANLIYKQNKIFDKKIDETDLNFIYAENLDEDLMAEPEIKKAIDSYNVGRTIGFKNMVVEPNILVGVKTFINNGIIETTNQLENIEYGSNFIMQIKEIDKKNNRIKYRIDYSRSNIESYSESMVTLKSGEKKVVRKPQLTKLDVSKEFYVPIKMGATHQINIDSSNYLIFTIDKISTSVETIVIDDKKTMAAMKKAKEEEEKRLEEEAIQLKKEKDENMFEELEEKLK